MPSKDCKSFTARVGGENCLRGVAFLSLVLCLAPFEINWFLKQRSHLNMLFWNMHIATRIWVFVASCIVSSNPSSISSYSNMGKNQLRVLNATPIPLVSGSSRGIQEWSTQPLLDYWNLKKPRVVVIIELPHHSKGQTPSPVATIVNVKNYTEIGLGFGYSPVQGWMQPPTGKGRLYCWNLSSISIGLGGAKDLPHGCFLGQLPTW